MLGIAEYFWRLVPANPILLRVVATAGKRRRDLLIRCGYLGLLVLVVLFFGPGMSGGGLSELAKASAQLFQRMSYLQLGLVALLAPIFTAGAITQERDSQTYDILLSTPLSNGQIVLGSLLSRLFFIIALLISGIPIFATTQIFGGVAINSIVQSFMIAAATAFVTGALAIAIAVLKVGTRRTILSFYLFLIFYLVGLFILDGLPLFQVVGHQTSAQVPSHVSWFTGLQPFLALRAIMHDPSYTPPLPGDLPEGWRTWPIGWYLTDPAGFYTTFMISISFLLVLPSIVLLRRMAQSSTSPKAWVLQALRLSTGDKTRKPRTVWHNPVAWREAKTKGSASRATLLRWGFALLGLVGAATLVVLYSSFAPSNIPDYVDSTSFNPVNNELTVFAVADQTPTTLPLAPDTTITLDGNAVTPDQLRGRLSVVATPKINNAGTKTAWASVAVSELPRRLSAAQARKFLLGATVLEFAIILLIVTNAAASTVTREKEDGTLDLLLSTPITSRFYIWGKLRGLVSFVLPLVAVPVLSVALFVAHDIFHAALAGGDWQWIAFPEALLLMPGTLIMVCAFAAIVGMQMSLRCRKTVVAVMSSVAIVVGLCAVLGFCGFQLLQSPEADSLGVGAGSFSPFTLLTMEIDPADFASGVPTPGNLGPRTMIFVCNCFAVAAYAGIVAAMYKSMVKNFDMTIRRQSR
jgi:ABC-type transport system involved in multi-copper enzyme maturation permease subunit